LERELRIFGNFGGPVLALAGAMALSGCGGTTSSQTADIYNPQTSNLPGAMATDSGSSLLTIGKGAGAGAQANQIQVNAYLWRATLDTLAFMPLVSADPFGGVVITDWYVPPATPGERFKVNAYILSKQMTANAVQVSVFHQVQQDGQWVDSPADPATASGLEDRILAQAADLQAEAQNTK
jgi:hypothetical protein